ncbi:MAG: prolyl oligopeptidase family serine peptidase, partial [Kangiellaceae bacterium]|nr:prolyl oligopeptidase family serine peptidase [Kangiellaceae bacterium]
FFTQKQPGSTVRDLYQVNLADLITSKVPYELLDTVDNNGGSYNIDRTKKAYARFDDIFLKDLNSGVVSAITRTNTRESSPRFLSDGRLSFRRGNDLWAIDLATGITQQLTSIEFTSKEKAVKADGFLARQQIRLFNYLQLQDENKKARKRKEKLLLESNQFGKTPSFTFDKNKRIAHLSLSPNGRFAVLALTKKGTRGKQDNMPRFISEDGYVTNQKVRTLVGQQVASNHELYILDLLQSKSHKVSYKSLPQVTRDPLAKLKKATAKKNGKKYKKFKGLRDVYVHGWSDNAISWSRDGNNVAINLQSYDNKDRWLASVDFNEFKLNVLHHLSDPAWINDWTFNQMGWLNDNVGFYFLSEKSGYSHIYVKKNKRASAKQLTNGKFEVSDLVLSNNDNELYFKANKKHPGIYEIYKVAISSGKTEQLTNLGGMTDYRLSPDEKSLLLIHSSLIKPNELSVKDLDTGRLTAITSTVSPEFSEINWNKPEIIAVPSSNTEQPIYSKVYRPKDFDPKASKKYPAVVFVHGAGYLQNSHYGWSGYFREFMFHHLLTEKGYVVIDMDYRASKGYGRDWRTAIYRNMGTPELQDILDGKNWLVENMNVDSKKVGIYGGSYGGFMTFMAMFNAPGEFAAGAALRPVTDWSSYNHGYTSNILNTPEVDPEAYNISSPIEFADGLQSPLLIAHGMVDDNVFFKDSVRLVQRLIELEKTELFETAIYPVEPHGFRQPSSWLDEYTRIYNLFEDNLK